MSEPRPTDQPTHLSDRPHHVVTGAGPVGSTVALQLAEAGERVVLLTRSGSGPDHPLIERRRGSAAEPGDLAPALEGAAALHHCVHASQYDAATWRAELIPTEQTVLAVAGAAGVVVVFPESLYAFGVPDGPMTEDHPRAAGEGKPGVRTALLRARDASTTATVSVAASDFLGPRVITSHAGERLVPALMAGRKVRVMGSLDQPHSFTYVPDLAAAMIRAAADPGLHGRLLLAPTAPAPTQRELARLVATAADAPGPRLGTLPAGMMRAIGLVHGGTRELLELDYQFSAPFVVDSSRSEELLGLTPTPLETAVKETVAWWRARQG